MEMLLDPLAPYTFTRKALQYEHHSGITKLQSAGRIFGIPNSSRFNYAIMATASVT
jgi:hypothetical protein